MMRKIKLNLLTIFFVFFISSAYAQTIQVITEEWAPYNYKEKGIIKGFSTEIVKATLKQADIKYQLKLYPWARAYKMAKTNKNILIYTISRTSQREKMFKWVAPLAPMKTFLFKLKNNRIKVKSLQDLKKHTVGLVRGDVMHEFFESKGFSAGNNILLVTKPIQNIIKLLKGRIDFMIGNEIALSYQVNKMGFQFTKFEKVLLLINDGFYYMAFSKQTDDALVEKLKQAFEVVKRSGELKKIKQKYLGK